MITISVVGNWSPEFVEGFERLVHRAVRSYDLDELDFEFVLSLKSKSKAEFDEQSRRWRIEIGLGAKQEILSDIELAATNVVHELMHVRFKVDGIELPRFWPDDEPLSHMSNPEEFFCFAVEYIIQPKLSEAFALLRQHIYSRGKASQIRECLRRIPYPLAEGVIELLEKGGELNGTL